MIFVDAYFDESLPGQSVKGEPVPEYVVVAGFANLSSLWLPFALDWGKVLERPRAVEYFHSVEANGRRDQFEGFSRPERDQKVIALLDVIQHNRPQPLISAVHPADYENLSLEFPGVMPPDPYIFCLFNLMIEAFDLNASRKTAEPFRIALVFENNDAMRARADETFRYALTDKPELANVFESLTFADKKRQKPLQAADALAYDLNKDFSVHLHNPGAPTRPSLEAILEKVPRRGVYWPWDYADLRQLFMKRHRTLTGKGHEDKIK